MDLLIVQNKSLNTILNLHDERKKSVLVMAGCLVKDTKVNFKRVTWNWCFTGVGDYDKIDLLVNEKKKCLFKWSIFG